MGTIKFQKQYKPIGFGDLPDSRTVEGNVSLHARQPRRGSLIKWSRRGRKRSKWSRIGWHVYCVLLAGYFRLISSDEALTESANWVSPWVSFVFSTMPKQLRSQHQA